VSAPKIQADYDGLNEIAKHFAAKAQDTNRLIQTVDRCVDELRRGAWIGKGASQFYAEMEREVSPAMLRLRNALNDASSATTRIAQVLERHEREAAALFYGGDGAGGAVSAGGAAAVATSGPSDILELILKPRRLLEIGRDDRNGYVKAAHMLALLGVNLGGPALCAFLGAGVTGISGGTLTIPGFLALAGGNIAAGVMGGVVDIIADMLHGREVTMEGALAQLISGGIQGTIGATQIGQYYINGELIVRAVGYAGAQLISDNAMWLANNDWARAQEIRDTADRISLILDNVSLDSVIDGAVNALPDYIKGDQEALTKDVTAVARYFVGALHLPAEMFRLATDVGEGLLDRLGDRIDQLVPVW